MNSHQIMTALSCLVNLAEANCLDNEIYVDELMEDETLFEDAKYQRDSINAIKEFIALWADNKVTVSVPLPTLMPALFDISTEQYNPVRCPHCNSENITAYDYDFDIRSVVNNIRCDDCESTWDEYFELAGVMNLEINE